VTTARWIHDHLPEDAVVATHDVGALAYYSGRRIVDMVGLISPEVIDRIGHDDQLIEYLRAQHVTHLAVLRTWFAIANVRPVFATDVMRPEVMEVFAFEPDRLHVTDHTAALLTEQARMDLAAGNVRRAGALLQRALLHDMETARIHFLLGRALLQVGRPIEARQEFDAALRLQPDLQDEVASELHR
jgi:tetratricopeptide (TPR) repeat protein